MRNNDGHHEAEKHRAYKITKEIRRVDEETLQTVAELFGVENFEEKFKISFSYDPTHQEALIQIEH